MLKQKINNRFSKFFIATSFITLLSACGGEGLDASLDARGGYDVNYHSTLSTAMQKMTPEQIEAYNWVVNNLSEGYFISNYGKKPTVREVIDGQLDRWTKSNTEAILTHSKITAGLAQEIAENTALRNKAVELLSSMTVAGEVVESKGNGQNCQGIVCNDVTTSITYSVKNPNQLKLTRFDCSAVVTPSNSSKNYTFELDGCSKEGLFTKKITPPNGISLAHAKVSIVLDNNSARTTRYVNAIPEELPEVIQMKRLEEVRKNIAEARASL